MINNKEEIITKIILIIPIIILFVGLIKAIYNNIQNKRYNINEIKINNIPKELKDYKFYKIDNTIIYIKQEKD